jgi:type I restriction enzyme S subunit
MAKMYMAYIQNGAARDGLNFEQIGNLLLALPTSDERALIVDHLSQQYLQFSELISRVEESVALLHERRSALISAAVTGKIDVRGLAPQ